MLDLKAIEAQIKTKGFAEVTLKNGYFTIEPRPSYCDRGNFYVKVFPDEGQFDLHIDGADMFPRYYFRFENMISEMQTWIFKNRQEV